MNSSPTPIPVDLQIFPTANLLLKGVNLDDTATDTPVLIA